MPSNRKNRIRDAVIIHLFSWFTAKKLASNQVFVIDDSVKVAMAMWDMKKVRATHSKKELGFKRPIACKVEERDTVLIWRTPHPQR